MAVLGELEHRVMAFLWVSESAQSVREVHEKITAERELAYTTVMTVLDRLAKKNLVVRRLEGRAWLYEAAVRAPDLVAGELIDLLASIPGAEDASLVSFAERLSDHQRELLLRQLA